MQKNYTALSCIGVYCLLKISERCASGLVASGNEVKSRLGASLLKEDHGNAQMAGCPDVAWWLCEPFCDRGLMGAHAY